MQRLVLVVCAALASVSVGCGSSDGAGAGAPKPAPSMNPGPDGSPPSPGSGTDGGSADDGAGTVLPASCTGLPPQPLDNTWTVSVGGQNRTAQVHVPASYDRTHPTPLILNFHGYTSNGGQEEVLTLMNQKADTAGFLVVYPEGEQSSWNAGACCGYATQNKVDDLGFVNALLDKLEAALCVDVHRVYSTGMSNGGFFTHRLGCELSNRIAAIAPVAGVLGEPSCTPSRSIPIIEFHGTADAIVPYNGSTALNFPAVPDTFAGWAKRDGCTDMPVETFRKVDSHCSTYSACAAGSTVTLCTVDGGGHTWPGGTPVPFGYTTPNLSATDAMWDFFQKHPLP